MSRNSTCEDGEDRPGQFASPPCFMHELDPSYMGVPVDPQQTCDVARWRKCERERLIAARFAMPTDERLEHAARIAKDLDAFIAIAPETIISVYWPIRGEPDLRPWITTLCKKGVRIALPAVAGAGLPLLFREWLPGAQMERGAGNIPFPGGGAALLPIILVAPLVGFDPAGYQLGYGGGFLDRTLAHLRPRPLAIGVGYPIGLISTIYPQAQDIPMDWIVTGSGALMRRPGL
ncbi:MAG: 5-formyltetrahydrofolate cyclo-ligase [Rhodomicrobium sp.]